MNEGLTGPATRAVPVLVPLFLILVLGRAPALGDDGTGGDTLVAAWQGGTLERPEYDDWRAAKGLDDEPETVRELVFVKSLAEIAEARLDARGAKRVQLEVEARRQRLLVPALERHVRSRAEPVDEKELEEIRKARPQAFVRPRKLRLRNLYKSLSGAESAAAVREAMAEIHRRLEDGADFEQLAEQESESQTRFRGGRLGLVDPEELPASLADAVRDLGPGELTPPLEHGGGLTIFLCEEIRPAKTPSPDEVRAKLRVNLERQRWNRRWEEYRRSLLDDVELDVGAVVPHLAKGKNAEKGPALTVGDYRLAGEDVALLADLRLRRPLEALSSSEIEDLLRDWALGTAAAERAVELGLGQEPELAASLRWIRTEVLARRELVRRIDAWLETPDDDALRERLAARAQGYRQLATYEILAIHFGEEQDLGSVQEVLGKVSRGELTFEEAARRYSSHGSAASGGRLGSLTPPQLVRWGPIASRAIRSLEPGETTDLLRLETGLWVFRLLDHRAPRTLTFEEARPQLLADLRAERIQELEQRVRAEHLESVDLRLESESRPDAARPDAARPDAARPIVVRWSTAQEHERFGYHVYRADREEGPFARITEEVVAGGGTTDLPRSYRFEDPEVESGRTYYYYVEAVSTDGTTKPLTPVRAVAAKPNDEKLSDTGENTPP